MLFLGDQGHHRPADRAAQITPVLAGRGIDVTYTEKLDDLNAETLARYDALLIYANITEIEPRPGKGPARLRRTAAAASCRSTARRTAFSNSPRYIALVGAQFQRHGTGEFDTKIVDPSHPIMKGFVPFRTWDETYVHHQAQRQGPPCAANARRRESRRSRGPGCGPRARDGSFTRPTGTMPGPGKNPSFHDLIERGIRWASAKGEVFDSRGRVAAGLPPFAYERVAGRDPQLSARPAMGDAGRGDPQDAKAADAGRVDQAPGRPARLRAAAVRGRARDLQAALHGLGPSRTALDRREHRLSQHQAARRPGPRPDLDSRRHRRRRPGRLVQGLRRGPEYSHQPRLP